MLVTIKFDHPRIPLLRGEKRRGAPLTCRETRESEGSKNPVGVAGREGDAEEHPRGAQRGNDVMTMEGLCWCWCKKKLLE